MSSHHVVRDAQEPALLILNPTYLTHEQLSPLLEWSPTIVVSAEALQEIMLQGIKVDALICPEEKQAEMKLLVEEQAPVALITHRKAESPLSAALSYLKENGHRAVNIMSAEKPLQGELLPELARQDKIPQVVVLAALSRYALCRTGKFSKWFPAEESIWLIPATEEPVAITTRGFAGKMEQITLKGPVDLKSTTAGTTSIQANGAFWVVEQLGNV